MKYRCRQLLPDAGRGAIFEKKDTGYTHQINEKRYIGFPAYIVENNADWFEPIEEKTDEELLSEWMFEIGHLGTMYQVRTLLSENAISPEFLASLRKGEK